MKTSEDNLNDALREVLKRKFDDYEEQPNANALDRIQARVKPARTGRYWWFTGALVLVMVGGFWMNARMNGGSPVRTKALMPSSKLVHNQPAAAAVIAAPSPRVVLRDPVFSRKQSAPALVAVAALPAEDAVELLENTSITAAEIPSVEELAALPASETPVPLHLRDVEAPALTPRKALVNNPSRTAWLFNASALHSYQILTVPSSAAQDFQNFSFPSLLTASSMGVKLSGGVERKGMQVLLHYSGFKQTYSYEVANDNYLVTPDSKGQYHTIRQGDRIEENRKFAMLGIGIAKQLRWGHSPVSRFYAALGAEYSHDLRSSQGLGWVNLGLGKQFAVSRNAAFSIGPYAEFSPVKVKGTTNPFFHQPYRVGISAGLRFVKP